MILPYLRSSALAAIEFCEQSFFIQYGLAIRGDTNLKAIKGTVCHKIMELYAKMRLAVQNGETEFFDDETGINFSVSSFSYLTAMDGVFSYYQEMYPKLKDKEKKDCLEWVEIALNHRNGRWNPLNQNILQPEQFFDFPIEKEWARVPGTDEYLRLRGTIDLVTLVDEDTINVTDYKFGQRMNWRTYKEKDAAYFYKDPQLRLYHYACSHIFPQYESIVMNIFWVLHGGVFPIVFGPEEVPKTERMLEDYYNRILRLKNPQLISNGNGKPCKTFCYFGKTASPEDPSKSICRFYADAIKAEGMEAVVDSYADKSQLNVYTGGGRTDVSVKQQ